MDTARLALHRPRATDVLAILAVHADPLACTHNPSDALTSIAEATALFQRWDEHWRRFGFGYWVVRTHDSATPLGFCGVKDMRLDDRPILNLFYRFAPGCWGNGYATEATTSVVVWATTHHPDLPVVARVRPDNVASQRVADRAGLVRTPHLDRPGFDGFDEPDWIYVSSWPPR